MRSKFKWIFTLLLAFSMQFSFAQEKTVTGTVTEGGLPLPGVSVVIKGTTQGTQTDMDGNYSIKGYPTVEHREAIQKYGITKYHRKSFRLLPEQLKLEL